MLEWIRKYDLRKAGLCSAVVGGNLQLLIFAVLFAPCHILISYMNAILKIKET
ncbi:hypothetical protein [Blautia massiliensis (ex Durand et al. 2017)]|uniref:hypothetical protein n=1 Tax=Blautia massiliensis (ex Durand et al. 2017) TaxID=1737424 RepID=UPI0022E47491|nr:hypothetical protein [Blautia massiliensis (ex Durand et al. 2017)]